MKGEVSLYSNPNKFRTPKKEGMLAIYSLPTVRYGTYFTTRIHFSEASLRLFESVR
jgi:hypothetical protein